MPHERPVVLAIAGLDPSGGAGLQADIQTMTALQCHCISVITTNTVQDSCRLHLSQPVTAELIDHQLRVLETDFGISAIKLGALGSADNAVVVAQFIQRIKAQNPALPVILDPVLSASTGGQLGDAALQQSLIDDIIPLCTLITPNEPELSILADDSSAESAAIRLAELGASVLITGGHNRDHDHNILENRLIMGSHPSGHPKRWTIKLIEGEFRGTGCTFSSAIAGYMAFGLPMTQAIEKAQDFVSYAVENAYSLSSGQRVPLRISRPDS